MPQHSPLKTQKLLALTPGEPAGIGPELIIQLAQETLPCPILVFADKHLMQERAEQLGLNIRLKDWKEGLELHSSELSGSGLFIKHVPLTESCHAGQLNVKNAPYVLNCLDQAINACLSGDCAALVTGPLHKGIINEAGIRFSGHTEHLQERCEVNKVVMMLASPRMRVALASTHLPLADVSQYITSENLEQVTRILIEDLQTKFGISCPQILVAGLNPHAGENGHMGREEIDVIEPVLEKLSGLNADLLGPLPADTLFNKKYLETADAVLAMYHDQGLPVLKFDGFGESVNITLGLPMIRTSVDHGTALDLAGTGQADTGSLETAIKIALEMAEARQA